MQQALRGGDVHEAERQFEAVKLRLVAHLLAQTQPVVLRLSTADGKSCFTHKPSLQARAPHQAFSLANIERTLSKSSLSIAGASDWKAASAKSDNFSIRVAINLIPAPSKQCQFASIGEYPLPRRGLGQLIYKEVNHAFENSHFGSVTAEDQQQSTRPDARLVVSYRHASLRSGLHKGVNRWPCFYLRIDTRSASGLSDVYTSDLPNDELTLSMQEVLSLVSTITEQFLFKHSFRPRERKVVQRHQTLPHASVPPPSVPRTNSATGPWRRTKGLGPPHQSDIQSGLPFTESEAPEALRVSAASEFEILLRDIESDAGSPTEEGNHVCVAHGIPDLALNYSAEIIGQHDLSWRDPRTGHHLHLDPYSGFIVAQEGRGKTKELEGGIPTGQPQRPKLVSRARPTKTSNAGLVSRLNNWPGRLLMSKEDLPIQSTLSIDETGGVYAQPERRQHKHAIHAHDLAAATILGQVDSKFVLAITDHVGECNTTNCGPRLILIDQHAADERVKVEELYRSLCSGQQTVLPRPLTFEIDSKESELLTQLQDYFQSWCFRYKIELAGGAYTLSVTHLPQVIAERCRVVPRTLIDLLRREVWSDQHRIIIPPSEAWLTRINSCPSLLLDLINSRACRSAIMFNDILTHPQCGELLRRLSSCVLPFQCAHGRPSMTVLTDLTSLDIGYDVQEKTSFGQAALN